MPKETFEALAAREEAVSYLVALINKVTKHAANFENQRRYNGHIYASFLLAQFRERTLLPVFLDFLSLPFQKIEALFGDLLTESAGQMIASVMVTEQTKVRGIKNPAIQQMKQMARGPKEQSHSHNQHHNNIEIEKNLLPYPLILLKEDLLLRCNQQHTQPMGNYHKPLTTSHISATAPK